MPEPPGVRRRQGRTDPARALGAVERALRPAERPELQADAHQAPSTGHREDGDNLLQAAPQPARLPVAFPDGNSEAGRLAACPAPADAHSQAEERLAPAFLVETRRAAEPLIPADAQRPVASALDRVPSPAAGPAGESCQGELPRAQACLDVNRSQLQEACSEAGAVRPARGWPARAFQDGRPRDLQPGAAASPEPRAEADQPEEQRAAQERAPAPRPASPSEPVPSRAANEPCRATSGSRMVSRCAHPPWQRAPEPRRTLRSYRRAAAPESARSTDPI